MHALARVRRVGAELALAPVLGLERERLLRLPLDHAELGGRAGAAPSVVPSAKIDLPSGAHRMVLITLKFGSEMHCGACCSLATCRKHRSWSLRGSAPLALLSLNIAITFASTVGAHAGSPNFSPGSVSPTGGSSGFARSRRKRRRLLRKATFSPSAENVGSVSSCEPFATAGKRLAVGAVDEHHVLAVVVDQLREAAGDDELDLRAGGELGARARLGADQVALLLAGELGDLHGDEPGVGGRLRRLGDGHAGQRGQRDRRGLAAAATATAVLRRRRPPSSSCP